MELASLILPYVWMSCKRCCRGVDHYIMRVPCAELSKEPLDAWLHWTRALARLLGRPLRVDGVDYNPSVTIAAPSRHLMRQSQHRQKLPSCTRSPFWLWPHGASKGCEPLLKNYADAKKRSLPVFALGLKAALFGCSALLGAL